MSYLAGYIDEIMIYSCLKAVSIHSWAKIKYVYMTSLS